MKTFETEWRARFERFAQTSTDEAEISGWSEAGLRRRVALFTSLLQTLALPPTARALELGCGAGTYVRLLAGLGHRAVGLDYSLPSLARAVAADPGAKGQYVAGEAYALPFDDESFDLVVSIGVLQALSQPERAIGEMARLLRRGGLLLVEALNGRALPARTRRARDRVLGRPARVRTYDPADVRRWLDACGLRPLCQPALCLPPRRLPALGRVFEFTVVLAAIEARPALTDTVAHAFWFVARKPAHPATASL